MIHQTVNMVLLALTHILCLAAMTERKYSTRKTALVYGVFGVCFVALTMVVFTLIGNEMAITALVGFSSTILVSFFVFMMTSADPAGKKVFLFISHANVFCMVFCITDIVSDAFFSALPHTGLLYVKTVIRTLLYVLLILVYIRFLRPAVRLVSGAKKKTWYSISLVSVLFLIIFSILVTAFYAGPSAVYYVSLFSAVVLLYCSVLWIIFGTIRSMSNESRMELINKKAEYLQGQLVLARENELAAKTLRHDFRHHNRNVMALLKQGDVNGALRYMEQYDESIDATTPNGFCPHTTVNAILNSFSAKAEQSHIPISVSVDTLEETSISDMDFVAILSNLLENAVNGCKECGSQGEIQLNIRTVAGKTVIVCSNPCTSGLAIENNMPKHKGTGIESILLAARKYNGDIRYELENGRLTVCIILNT